MVDLQLDTMAGNAQVFKASSKKGDRWHIAFERMLGDGLHHNPVGRHHLQNIQSLDGGGRQCSPALPGLGALIAGDPRVGRAERNNPLETEILEALGEVPALFR